MIELRGKYNTAKVFTDILENEAISQIIELCNQEFVKDSQIRIMPDVHAGAGCTIGTTLTISDKVVPNLVGVDIGCFTGDTRVKLLDNKDSSIKELAELGSKFCVYSSAPNGKIKVSWATAFKTKDSAGLMEIVLDNGASTRCTPDHKFMLRDGSYKEAAHLLLEDSLMPLYLVSDKDGYTLVRQNNTGNLDRVHWVVARSGLLGSVPQFENQRTIIHHKDFEPSNNLPDILNFMGHSDHNIMHRFVPSKNKHWHSCDFERNRVLALKRRSLDPAYRKNKCTVASANLRNFMK